MPELVVHPHTLPSLPNVATRPSISATSPSVSMYAESYAAPSQSHDSTASSNGFADSNPDTPTRASPRHHKLHSAQPSTSPRRMASKAADLLYGGHKSDGHGKKVYDLLGMTAKQYDKVQHDQQQKQHEHDSKTEATHDKTEETKEATDVPKPMEHTVAAGGGHRRQNSRVVGQSKAMDLLYGGHKADSKVGDMLGVSKQEIEHFRESQKAYQKLGVGATHAAHDALPRDMHLHASAQQQQQQPPAPASNSNSTTAITSPASTNTRLVLFSPSSVSAGSSLSSLSISNSNQHGNRRASISKKASDLLYGSNKSNSKVEDRLGVMEKELETFGRIPKAYQLMGVYDHREIREVSKLQAMAQTHPAQHRVAAGQLLSPPAAYAEMSVSTPSMLDRPMSFNRPVSLSMVPISPLSTFTALPNIPPSPARHSSNGSRNKHSLDIPPLSSSRPSTAGDGTSSRSLSARSDSDASTSAASTAAALSPRSRKVILQPLAAMAKGPMAGPRTPLSPGGKLNEVTEECEEASAGALSAAARVRARERASRLKSKVKVAVALSSWQQAAASQAAKATARTTSSSAASSPLLFAPTTAALQLGVSGRSLHTPAPVTTSTEQPDESTIVSSLRLSPTPVSPPRLPQALRPLPGKPNRRQQLSPVKANRRSLLPGEVREELASGGAKRWGKVGAAVHVAAALKSGVGTSSGLGSPIRGRGEFGFPTGKSTVYVAANYKV